MKQQLRYLRLTCAVLLLSATSFACIDEELPAKAQKSEPRNPAVVVVGSAAKGTWALTKFATKTIAKPTAKAVFLKAAPAITKFALKNAAKHALPLMLKLSVL